MHRRKLAFIACPMLEPKAISANLEQEAEIADQYLSSLYGGVEKKEDRKSKVADSLRKAWEREFGKIDSPETQKKIQDTAASLRQERLSKPRNILRERSRNTV